MADFKAGTPVGREEIAGPNPVLRATVALLDSNRAIVGTGFLVSETWILTCAHVVEEAGSGLHREVAVRFQANHQELPAKVCYLRKEDDLAVLEISRAACPPTARALKLGTGDPTGGRFKLFGYPYLRDSDVDGVWAEGRVVERTPDDSGNYVLQLNAENLDRGMSGGPVYAASMDAVVGILRSVVVPDPSGRHGRTGWATPAPVFLRLFPGFGNVARVSRTGQAITRRSHVRLPQPVKLRGREKVYSRILATFAAWQKENAPPGRRILLVTGSPGVGKTALLASVARDPQTLDLFSDGILYASLGRDPRRVQEVLEEWGGLLQIPGLSLETDAEEVRIALTEGLLGKRMLLILDEVWNHEDLKPFLAEVEGCALLIAAQSRGLRKDLENLSPGQIIHLESLEAGAGLALLEDRIPEVVAAQRVRSDELVRALDGLPLALVTAGCWLKEKTVFNRNPAGLLDTLFAPGEILEIELPAETVDWWEKENKTIKALLDVFWEALPDRDLFVTLGAFYGHYDVIPAELLRRLWNVPKPDDRMDEFIRLGLMERLPGGEAVQVPAVFLAYALARLDQRAESQGFLRTIHRQAARYYSGRRSRDPLLAAFHYLYAEEFDLVVEQADSVLKDVETATNRGQVGVLESLLVSIDPDRLSDLQHARWQNAQGFVANRQQKMERAQRFYQSAVNFLVSRERLEPDLRKELALAYQGLGECAELNWDLEAALSWFDHALEAAREVDDPELSASLHFSAGNSAWLADDLGLARQHAQQGWAARPAGRDRLQARGLILEGNLLFAEGAVDEGIEKSNQAIKICEATGDFFFLIRCLLNRSFDLYFKNRWSAALNDITRAWGLAERFGSLKERAEVAVNFGALATQIDPAQAPALELEKTAELAGEIGLQREQAYLLTNLGELFFTNGDLAKARESLAKATSLADESYPELLPEIRRTQARVYLEQGNLPEAWRVIEASMADKGQEAVELGKSERVRGQILAAEGKTEAAHAALEASSQKLEEMPPERARTRVQQAVLYLKEGDTARAHEKLEAAGTVFENYGLQRDRAEVEELLRRCQAGLE